MDLFNRSFLNNYTASIANKKEFKYARYDAQFQLSLKNKIYRVPVRLTGPK